jgi:hypothetical protein
MTVAHRFNYGPDLPVEKREVDDTLVGGYPSKKREVDNVLISY